MCLCIGVSECVSVCLCVSVCGGLVVMFSDREVYGEHAFLHRVQLSV